MGETMLDILLLGRRGVEGNMRLYNYQKEGKNKHQDLVSQPLFDLLYCDMVACLERAL